jgi:hypothetical protein
MPVTELAFRPDVNVSIAIRNGRFSAVDQWPVLGVHRGFQILGADTGQHDVVWHTTSQRLTLLPVPTRCAATHWSLTEAIAVRRLVLGSNDTQAAAGERTVYISSSSARNQSSTSRPCTQPPARYNS